MEAPAIQSSVTSRGAGEDLPYPQFPHSLAKMCWLLFLGSLPSSGPGSENTMTVTLEGHRNPSPPDQPLYQKGVYRYLLSE